MQNLFSLLCYELHISPKLLYLTTSHYRPGLRSACRYTNQTLIGQLLMQHKILTSDLIESKIET